MKKNIIEAVDKTRRNKSAKGVISALLLIIIATFVMSNVAKASANDCPDDNYIWNHIPTEVVTYGSNNCVVWYEYCWKEIILPDGVNKDRVIWATNILTTTVMGTTCYPLWKFPVYDPELDKNVSTVLDCNFICE
jgi:hypothetical protein